VPRDWKTSEIVPVPKVKLPRVKNDLRPVALTSVLMKCLESFVKKTLCKEVSHVCDKFQFAYKPGRSVDDAILTLLDIICSHLDKAKTYSRVLFIDFSSAFNTIKPHIMLRKLWDMNVNGHLIKWIYSYLTERPQHVKLHNVTSGSLFTNTGAPQGCVLSPMLFTLYTSDCVSNFENCHVLKYADDTVIIGNISNNDTSSYLRQVEIFVDWCELNFLNLNVSKTKEMILDFRKDTIVHNALTIKNESVCLTDKYKYLGVYIDDKLNFAENVHNLYKKCLQRVRHLRELVNIRVDREILSLFYRSIIESVLSYSIV
jgi:hypothetical protein